MDNMIKHSIGGMILIVALIATASAETIQFGNYTATFDMKQPHVVDSNSIRTYYGNVYLYENLTNEMRAIDSFNMQFHDTEKNATETVRFIDYVGVGKERDVLFAKDNGSYFIIKPSVPEVQIISSMNLTSTLDFLKTLKIEKINKERTA